MKISYLFEPCDIWAGAYWDKKKKWLYLLPVPFFGIVIKFYPENIHGLYVGDEAWRKKSNGEWVLFTVNKTYIHLIAEFPGDYMSVSRYLITLLDEHGKWSLQQFWHTGDPTMPLRHLLEEVEEALNDPFDPSEYADMLALIVSAWYRTGKNSEELADAFLTKYLINQDRTWPIEPNDKGYFSHIDPPKPLEK